MLILRYLILFSAINFVKSSFNSHFLKDFLEVLKEIKTLTEFSCNKKESAKIFTLLATTDYKTRVLSISSFNIKYPIPHNNHVFMLNLQCPSSKEFLNKVDILKLFAAPLRWIFYYKNDGNISSNEVINKYFGDIQVLLDSDVNLVETVDDNMVVVRKLFKMRQNFVINVEKVGTWSETNGFLKEESFEIMPTRRRKNLSEVTLNSCIVITHNDSLNHLTDRRDKHIDSIAKVNYALVKHLVSIFNASLKYSVQPTWGYLNKSEWTGMVGELVKNKADIGGTPLFATKNRIDVIDYIAMTTPSNVKFIFRQPKLSFVSNVYTLPFDIKVWASTGFLLTFTTFALFIASKWELEKSKHEREGRTGSSELDVTFLGSLFLAIGAFCQQGAACLPFSFPGRITTIFLFLSLMFLYTSYAANIVALLQSSTNSIRTLEDLLNSRLEVGVDDTVFNHYYFKVVSDPIRKQLYNQKVVPPGKKSNFMPIEEGIKRMRQGLFAFHVEVGPGYKLISDTFREDEKCGLEEIKFLEAKDTWLAIQKNSSYKEIIKIGLRVIRESGIQQREIDLIYTKKPACTAKSSSFVSVGLVDCYPAAAILAGGVLVALVVLLCEVYLYHREKKIHCRWGIACNN